jgi:hypothetical protein
MKLSSAVWAFSLVLCGSMACCATASAQQPLVTKVDRTITPTLTTVTPINSSYSVPVLSAPPATPELWVYAQEQRRHDDPAQAVRRKAEFQADQRMSRLASLKWYGLSNARPEASPTPLTGTYSPGWIGNGWNRYDWVGVGVPAYVRVAY